MNENEKQAPKKRAYKIGFIVVIVLLSAFLALGAFVKLNPEKFQTFIAENIFLYAITSANIILITILLFLLARTIIKLVVERKKNILGSQFKTKLIAAFLLIAIVPSIGLFIVVRDLVGKSIDSLFNPPMETLLSDAFNIAEEYYKYVKENSLREAERIAESIKSGKTSSREALSSAKNFPGARRTMLYDKKGEVIASWAKTNEDEALFVSKKDIEQLGKGKEVARWDEPEYTRLLVLIPINLHGSAGNGAILALETGVEKNISAQAAALTAQYEAYKQLSIKKRTIKHSRVWTYGTIYLLIIFSAAWFGVYLARIITTPIEALLEGTRIVSAGQLDHRVVVDATDEIALLVQSFNKMTEDLSDSRNALESSNINLADANREIEERRRNIAAILENIPSGVLLLSPEGRVMSANISARHILKLEKNEAVEGKMAEELFVRAEAPEIWEAVKEFFKNPSSPYRRNITLGSASAQTQIILSIVVPRDETGKAIGTILVLEDITELSRAQKIAAWQEMAQRMAHEIKNPLTPIELSVQRVLKNYGGDDAEYRRIMKECVECINNEVSSLKMLVDEFSRFARLPSPNPRQMRIEECVDGVVSLYDGHFENIKIEKIFKTPLPAIHADPEQIRRALINLVENSIEATDKKGRITVSASYDEARRVIAIEVKDNGRGISPEKREKLFIPYAAAKARGRGLGLAIVNRIVSDHKGRIFVRDNSPRGAVFTIELPA